MSAEAGARLVGALTDKRTTRSGGYIGAILEAGQGRLRLTCGGIQLEKEDLWVTQELEYNWDVDTGKPNLLRQGDRVVLLSEDDQDYYLIAKVVRP